jgi:hypothetical protein
MVRVPHRGLALQLLPKVSAAGSGLAAFRRFPELQCTGSRRQGSLDKNNGAALCITIET